MTDKLQELLASGMSVEDQKTILEAVEQEIQKHIQPSFKDHVIEASFHIDKGDNVGDYLTPKEIDACVHLCASLFELGMAASK